MCSAAFSQVQHSLSPPPPPRDYNYMYSIQYSEWQGRRLFDCVGDHTVYCRTFRLCLGADSESTKLLDHPMTKAEERR
jgi:hypothetical protein